MTDGTNKPTHYVVCVDKSDKTKKTYLGKIWNSGYGQSIGLEKPYNDRPGVKSLIVTFTDGTTVDLTNTYININEYKGSAPRASGDAVDTDNYPF